MLVAVSSIMDFIKLALCWVTITFSLVIYRGRGSKAFLFIALYAIVQMVVEMKMRGGEIGSPLSLWLIDVFDDTIAVKSMLYGVSATLSVLVLFQILELQVEAKDFILPVVIFVWMIVFPSIRSNLIINYYLYILPYELFIVGLSLIALRRMKKMPQQNHFPMMRRMIIAVLILTVLTILEDTYFSYYYGFMEDLGNPASGIVAKERNYCECLLQIVLLISAIHAGANIVVSALNTDPTIAPIAPPKNLESTSDHFAQSIGLSPREKEVLPLLENKSVQEIAEVLYVSQGTVKAHTHNIYQKADVSGRVELIQKASAFSAEK